MYTVTAAPMAAFAGEPVEIILPVTDNATPPEPVTVAGASAVFVIGKAFGKKHIYKSDQAGAVALSGSTATVNFNMDVIAENGKDLFGDFIWMLQINIAGVPLYVAQGIITKKPVVL